ncbi:MAG: amidohydrolase [Gammaproteobacteria bacterium]|tara:strand:- start:8528 stop:9973 length:1446 start_codon:yes stop_codon:yes gene_type:complete
MGRKKSLFRKQSISALILILLSNNILSDDVLESIESHKTKFQNVALEIWNYAELGYQEEQSSSLLASSLEDAGFTIKKGVAGIPSAFIAEFNNGGPVIGILGEFDALPGLAQTTSPFKEVLDNPTGAGHACGHHLFGAASAWAAVSVKEWIVKNNIPGTIRFYGTPAEEGGSGKVYMVREGLFNDVDIVLHWHPDDANSANSRTSNSNKSAKFTFNGISAHAAGSPEQGRSALDGVEAMNHMVNMMREHIPQESRIHYVITKGGLAPNVVPDLAEVYYYVRHPKMSIVEDLFARVVNTASGAAMGTDTKMTYEVMHGNFSLLPNDTLQKVVHGNLKNLGGITYDGYENEYASEIYTTFFEPDNEIGSQELVRPFKTSHGYGSTDVGDVSWNVPTAGLRTATWVPGTASHSWQAVASGGTSIGLKGAELAAKTLAKSAVEIFSNPSIIIDSKNELKSRVGNDFQYKPLLGDREPPLDYRKVN